MDIVMIAETHNNKKKHRIPNAYQRCAHATQFTYPDLEHKTIKVTDFYVIRMFVQIPVHIIMSG
jgi:hypothetical protein